MAGIRVGGLFSGMDTQSTIDTLMALRRRPIELLLNRQAEIGYDIAAWTDVSAYMNDLTTVLDGLRSWDQWNQMGAASSLPTRVTASAAGGAAEGSYVVTVAQLATAHAVASDRASDLSSGAGSDTDLVAAGVLTAGDTFTVGGQTVSIGATESLGSLAGKINTAAMQMPAADGVKATIIDHRLVVTRDRTGAATISMEDSGGTPLQDLGILSAPAVFKSELTPAQDAEFTVNGITVTRSANTGLTDVIADVTLNLLGATDAEAATLTVALDRTAAKAAILDFIEKYNAAASQLDEVGKITLAGTSPKGSKVDGAGELHDDSLVREIAANLRRHVTSSKYPQLNPINASYTYQGQTGVCNSLSAIGIWTSGKENELSVTDEDRLDYMLENHFDEVTQLFRGIFVDGAGYAHGVASDFYRYSDGVSASMLGSIARRTNRLTDQVADIDTHIAQLEKRLADYENSLWQQFGAMEKAVQKMQSELDWLQAQLGAKQK